MREKLKWQSFQRQKHASKMECQTKSWDKNSTGWVREGGGGHPLRESKLIKLSTVRTQPMTD